MPYLIQVALKGSPSVGVIGGPANQVYSLIAKPQIKSFDDLKGKTIGLSLAIDTISIASRMLLDKHSIKESDFGARELVGTPVRSASQIRRRAHEVALAEFDAAMA
jgi:ABC-type nitrate/sulfonate/bicarbonate transport system substrate-binding protein